MAAPSQGGAGFPCPRLAASRIHARRSALTGVVPWGPLVAVRVRARCVRAVAAGGRLVFPLVAPLRGTAPSALVAAR
ncbi:MAG: hypothetical protein KDJ28_06495 [Candidatus Competibacteraceae bacterium]|nr:hypothetical protein [Candidatus Competibacteraceae bacterium]